MFDSIIANIFILITPDLIVSYYLKINGKLKIDHGFAYQTGDQEKKGPVGLRLVSYGHIFGSFFFLVTCLVRKTVVIIQ